MAVLTRSICLAGPDGAGKSTQADRLVARLADQGLACRLVTIWDLFAAGALPFGSKGEIDRFLGALHPDGRAMFLHSAMREAIDRAAEHGGEAVLLIVGGWYKYNATERAYGASEALLDALGAAFPACEARIYLDLPAEEALARKQVLSGYESGQRGREGFLGFQARVQPALRRLIDREGGFAIVDARSDADTVEAAIAEAIAPAVARWRAASL